MRNEEPTRTDPPPGSTGDLAADVGTSLSGEGHSERRLEDRSGTRGRSLRGDDASPMRSLGMGHVELRRLCGRPC